MILNLWHFSPQTVILSFQFNQETEFFKVIYKILNISICPLLQLNMENKKWYFL